MSNTRHEVEDELRNTIKEQKKILNNVSLVVIVWAMLLLLVLFLTKTIQDLTSTIIWIGVLSLIPVVILEIKIGLKLSKIKKEKTLLQIRKNLIPKDDINEEVEIQKEVNKQQ